MECSSIQYIKLALKSDIIHQHTFSGRFILPVIAGERVLSSDTAWNVIRSTSPTDRVTVPLVYRLLCTSMVNCQHVRAEQTFDNQSKVVDQ